MWKKLGVVFVSLIATCSVVYAINRDMSAAGALISGGNVTARINQAPASLTSSEVGFQKGDKVYIGTTNPVDNKPLGWQLIYLNNGCYGKAGCTATGYTDYVSTSDISTPVLSEPITAWLSATTTDLGAYKPLENNKTFTIHFSSPVSTDISSFSNFSYYAPFMAFKNSIPTEAKTLIAPRDLTVDRNYIYHSNPVMSFFSKDSFDDFIGKTVFLPKRQEFDQCGSSVCGTGYPMKVPAQDMSYPKGYLCTEGMDANNVSYGIMNYRTDLNPTRFSWQQFIYASSVVRPFTYLDLDTVVFATSPSTATSGNALSDTTVPTLPASYTKINVATASFSDMKVRVYDSSKSITFSGIETGGKPASTVVSGKTIDLKANANVGTNHTVSVLIFDSTNKLKYYMPLGDATGVENTYPLDTTGFPLGNYKISLVNEEYDNSSTGPSKSSYLSEPKDLEVVDNLSITSYTPHYESGASVASTYEYSKNVNPGSKIGSLAYKNGSGVPTFKCIANPTAPSGHENDYKNFEVPAGFTASPADVKILSTGAPDIVNGSLKAGDYYFRIEGVDSLGEPNPAVFIDVMLTVNKTLPTVTFSDTTTKYMKIGGATLTDTVITSNTDTLITSDVTYALSGGIPGVLTPTTSTSDSLTYDVSIIGTHAGTGLPATYTLKATVSETDNYLSATTVTNRNIIAYKEMTALAWSPSKGTYSSSDVITGSIVGTLLASDGAGPFKYEVVTNTDPKYDSVKGKDNASFSVSSTPVASGTNVNVTTASNLSIGTYNMQFKVTDASGDTFYTDGTITVIAKAQAALDFKDKAGGTIITTIGKKIKFDATSENLLAEGGSTTKTIEYELAPTAMQPSAVGATASSFATINKTSGLITPLKVGTIKVQAKRPGDGSYGDAITYMDLTIEPAPQKIDFLITTSPYGIELGKSDLVDAKGTITSTGAAGVGDITYSSDNTAIATVDSSGNVTGVSNGTITLTATLNDPGGPNYNPNYETATTTKTINIYTGMSVTWTEKKPYLLADTNKAGDDLGTINVTDNSGPITYTIATGTNPENADASFFQVVGSGTSATLQIKNPIMAAEQARHGGTFKVQIIVKDSLNTRTLDLSIQIDEATNTIYFTDGGKVTSLTKVFGENSNSFNLTSYSKNSGSATYSVDPSDTSGTLTVSGTGATKINKVGTATVKVVIGSGSGYAGGEVTMTVTVTPGNQAIAFKDTTTLNQKFVAGKPFSDPAELTETRANTLSSRPITYTSNTPSICTVDAIGTITMVAKGICDIDASNSDSDWTPVTTNKKINLYDGMGVSFAQTPNLQAGTVNTASNAPAGTLTVSGGSGTKTYAISGNSGPDNLDASLFKVGTSGIVSFSKAIKAADLVGKYDTVKKAYVLYVQVDTTDSISNTVTTNAVIELKGEKLNAIFETGNVGKIVEEYGLGKNFMVTLSSNAGGGVPTYQLKSDPSMPADVLQNVDPSGLVTILHANDPSANPNPVMVEAVIPASNGYDEETIEVEVEIVKAPQPAFSFKNTVINLGYEAQVAPILQGQLTTGTVVLTSDNNSISSIVSGTDIKANSTDGNANITAIAPGDRDYKPATAIATVNVSSAPAYSLVIGVPSATYGDTGLAATIVMNGATGASQVQTWSSSDPSIADIDASGNITIYKAGSVTISCKQTSTGEPSVTATATLVINPKPITVTINNESKYVGEKVPAFSAVIPTANLVGTDTIGQPNFSCKDGAALVKEDTKAGTYDITGAYPTGSYPNYKITVKKGTLTIKQDTSLAAWFHLEGDTSKAKLDGTKWYNEDVNVVLDPATESAGTYNEISLNKTLWDAKSIKVSVEGENNESVYFRINASDPTHPLAMSSPQSTTIKIDKTKPVIKSITGTTTNKDAVSTLLNKLTFGAYFKPGTKVSIKSEDILPKPSTKVSGVSNIAYEVFEIDKANGKIGTTAVGYGDLKPNASGISEVTLNDTGLYRVCAIATDNAGNKSVVGCSDLNVKNIDVDIDKDGTIDNSDPDNDGCPDINIVLKDKEDKFYKLNADRDGDKLPDLNIDSDGDGKADINIDTDNDGKPDLNLLIITKEMWKPTFCVTGQSDEYCTVKGLKPSINIDLDKDGIPDINIDTNGDMMADFNITKTGEEKPYLNIGTPHTKWEPKKDFTKDKFGYDTDDTCKPNLNIDSDHDGLPDINIDLDDDGFPDLNIDLDLDNIPDIDIDGDGDGKPDINLDTNKDGKADENIVEIKEWKPEKNVNKNGKDFDTMTGLEGKDQLEDNDFIVTKPGGVFLPNFAIKVDNVTDSIDKTEKDKINEYTNDDIEIKDIFNVKMYEGSTQVEPNGIIKVKIPLDAKYQNAKTLKIIVEQKDGTYKEIDVKIEDGFIVYETDYLGTISILADKTEVETPPVEEKPETPKQETPAPTKKPTTSVQGSYTSMGGALTGDNTSVLSVFFMLSLSAILIALVGYKMHKKDSE